MGVASQQMHVPVAVWLCRQGWYCMHVSLHNCMGMQLGSVDEGAVSVRACGLQGGEAALIMAIERGDADIVGALVAARADVDVKAQVRRGREAP